MILAPAVLALNLYISVPKRGRDPVQGAVLQWDAHVSAESFLLTGVNAIQPFSPCPQTAIDADAFCTVPEASGVRTCEYPPQSLDCLTTVQAWAGAENGPAMTEQDLRCDQGAGTGCPCDVLPSPAGCVE